MLSSCDVHLIADLKNVTRLGGIDLWLNILFIQPDKARLFLACCGLLTGSSSRRSEPCQHHSQKVRTPVTAQSFCVHRCTDHDFSIWFCTASFTRNSVWNSIHDQMKAIIVLSHLTTSPLQQAYIRFSMDAEHRRNFSTRLLDFNDRFPRWKMSTPGLM